MDHLQAGVEGSFAVFPEPSAFFQPCEGPLDDPSLGHDGEGMQIDRTRPGKAMVDGAGQPGIGYFAILAA